MLYFLKKSRKTPGIIIILPLSNQNLDDMIYSSWDIECEGLKLVILGYFSPFILPENPKNQNFEKMKKSNGDIIILHVCTKNHNHMMFDSWDREWDGWNFLIAILAYYLPFYPINNPGTQILKKWKK